MKRPSLAPSTIRIALACAVTGAALGGALSGVALADSSGKGASPAGLASSPGSTSAPTARPNYRKNAAGLTYGSLELAGSPAQAPDLILVEDTAGEQGYVKKTDLDAATGADVADPAQASAWEKQQDALAAAGKRTTVTVYDADGQTVVGEFIVWPSHYAGEGGGA